MSIFLFGDTYIKNLNDKYSGLFADYKFYGILGLPVTDIIVEGELERHCAENELVIWFCASWFNGIAEYSKFQQIAKETELVQIEKFRIAYLNPEKRYGVSLICNGQTTKTARDFMKSLFIESLKHYLQKYPNLYICPLNLFFHELLLEQSLPGEQDFWPKFVKLFGDRIVDSGPFTKDDLIDEKGNFNEKGYLKLKRNLEQFVQHIQSRTQPASA